MITDCLESEGLPKQHLAPCPTWCTNARMCDTTDVTYRCRKKVWGSRLSHVDTERQQGGNSQKRHEHHKDNLPNPSQQLRFSRRSPKRDIKMGRARCNSQTLLIKSSRWANTKVDTKKGQFACKLPLRVDFRSKRASNRHMLPEWSRMLSMSGRQPCLLELPRANFLMAFYDMSFGEWALQMPCIKVPSSSWTSNHASVVATQEDVCPSWNTFLVCMWWEEFHWNGEVSLIWGIEVWLKFSNP